MATLKVFVSSTCYDLGVVRSKLQEFFRSLGYEPVMSEHSDVLFDPRTHTHTSCVDEVANCDVVVLLIGSRFGGKAVPEALSRIDLSKVKAASSSTWSLDEGRSLSITQLEVLRSIELKQPVFAFVDERVMHDHYVYEKNKHKSILSDITFPSIERPESAPYIFEFINYLRLRNAGNAISTFARIDDIEVHLRKQWSALFQRMLRDDRVRAVDGERARQVQEQLDELKAAILSSIQAPEAREIARGVIRYRRLIDFASGLALPNPTKTMLDEQLTWPGLMSAGSVSMIARIDQPQNGFAFRTYLLLEDGHYLICRLHWNSFPDLREDIATFVQLPLKVREAVLEAWTETHLAGRGMLLPRSGSFEDHVLERGRGVVTYYYDAKDLTKLVKTTGIDAASTQPPEDADDIPF